MIAYIRVKRCYFKGDGYLATLVFTDSDIDTNIGSSLLVTTCSTLFIKKSLCLHIKKSLVR